MSLNVTPALALWSVIRSWILHPWRNPDMNYREYLEIRINPKLWFPAWLLSFVNGLSSTLTRRSNSWLRQIEEITNITHRQTEWLPRLPVEANEAKNTADVVIFQKCCKTVVDKVFYSLVIDVGKISHQVFIELPSRRETLSKPCKNRGKSYRQSMSSSHLTRYLPYIYEFSEISSYTI